MKHDKTKMKPGEETFNSEFILKSLEKLVFDYLVKKTPCALRNQTFHYDCQISFIL